MPGWEKSLWSLLKAAKVEHEQSHGLHVNGTGLNQNFLKSGQQSFSTYSNLLLGHEKRKKT